MLTVEERVKEVIAKSLDIADKDSITGNSSFVDDLGADSLDSVELVMALEEEFGAEISDSDAEKLVTVQQVIDYITEKLKKGEE